jgi:hypothetical protein
MADHANNKTEAGTGRKPDDRFALPLHWLCHRDQHAHGERDWWMRQGVTDPVALALAYYTTFCTEKG